jgi:hypothetical protein
LDRIFLDANVLFSAAYLENSGLVRLWQLEDAESANRSNPAVFKPAGSKARRPM